MDLFSSAPEYRVVALSADGGDEDVAHRKADTDERGESDDESRQQVAQIERAALKDVCHAGDSRQAYADEVEKE